jgi:exodeoxyribonuclease V alpha subunit
LSESAILALTLQTFLPTDEQNIRRFLKSGAVTALTPHLTNLLVSHCGQQALEALDGKNMSQVRGIGPKRRRAILDSWLQFKKMCELRAFLFENKLSLEWAERIWSLYGSRSLEKLKEEPYLVGCTAVLPFEELDAFAQNKGFAPDSFNRARHALLSALESAYQQGHCAYPEDKLLQEVESNAKISKVILEEALEVEILEDHLVVDSIRSVPCIYLKSVWHLEKEVSDRLLQFQNRKTPWNDQVSPKVLGWAERLLRLKLAPLQRQALETALSSSLTVITGGPGTGKTTIIRSLVSILNLQFCRLVLCSPTGRAAQRLEQATGVPAFTIHRLLKYNGLTGRFAYNRERPLETDLVLVDEASMMDLSLMNHLLDAIPSHGALILVGDADQIPSVGAGSVLQSIINSQRFSTVRLTDIFRQREKSLIKMNAHRINSGYMPLSGDDVNSDFHYLPVHGAEEMKDTVIDLVTRLIPQTYGINDARQIQILVPLNRGVLGTQEFNLELQQFLHVDTNGMLSTSPSGRPLPKCGDFKVGDKVMVVKNDYKKDIFNGDIGFIKHLDFSQQTAEVEFERRTVTFDIDEFNQLTLAHSISIHKSQGSEYRAVVVVLSEDHIPMAQRHLLYTAVTRGKEQVFLVAEPKALEAAILADDGNRRWERLTELLRRCETPPAQLQI